MPSDCFFLKLHLRTIDDLEGLLDRFTPFGRTTTSIIHSSPIDGRPLPIHRTHRKHAEAVMEFSDGVQRLVGRSARRRTRSEHSDGATWIDP